MLAPNNNKGMPYQTDEKHLNNLLEYYVEVVNLAFICYNNRFVLCVFTDNLLKFFKIGYKETRKMLRLTA